MSTLHGRSALVIGAGLVGLACARHLQRAGCHVRIMDRVGPGAGASHGNAAHIAIASIVPQATPGILRQSLGMLRRPDGPLLVDSGYLLRHAPWFARFVSLANPETSTAGTRIMAALLAQAWPTWHALLADTGTQALVRQSGALHVFGNAQVLAQALPAYERRRTFGIDNHVLSADEARALEPALTTAIAGAIHLPGMGYVTDTRVLCEQLAARIALDGGEIMQADVTRIGADGVQTAEGLIDADHIVLAAGAWSARFASELGVTVPVVSERGYHHMLPANASPLVHPTLLVERKVAITPMTQGIRLASVAEFTAPDAPARYPRAARVFEGLSRWVQGTDAAPVAQWVGPRPSTPDSRPIIGRAPSLHRVLVAYGHGHLGLTLAAWTGQRIAELAAGHAPADDLAWVSPTRQPGCAG